MKLSKVIFWLLLVAFVAASTSCQYGTRAGWKKNDVFDQPALKGKKGKPTLAVFYSAG